MEVFIHGHNVNIASLALINLSEDSEAVQTLHFKHILKNLKVNIEFSTTSILHKVSITQGASTTTCCFILMLLPFPCVHKRSLTRLPATK